MLSPVPVSLFTCGVFHEGEVGHFTTFPVYFGFAPVPTCLRFVAGIRFWRNIYVNNKGDWKHNEMFWLGLGAPTFETGSEETASKNLFNFFFFPLNGFVYICCSGPQVEPRAAAHHCSFVLVSSGLWPSSQWNLMQATFKTRCVSYMCSRRGENLTHAHALVCTHTQVHIHTHSWRKLFFNPDCRPAGCSADQPTDAVQMLHHH